MQGESFHNRPGRAAAPWPGSSGEAGFRGSSVGVLRVSVGALGLPRAAPDRAFLMVHQPLLQGGPCAERRFPLAVIWGQEMASWQEKGFKLPARRNWEIMAFQPDRGPALGQVPSCLGCQWLPRAL